MAHLVPGYVSREALELLAPERLSELKLGGLYVCGSLEGLAAPTVAVVGTRAPSEAGRRLAFRLAEELGRAGVCIVSGLALGVDAAAHRGAVAVGAPTIGVLGGGHTRFYPRANLKLAEAIVAAGGAVVSPFEPEHAAYPSQFLQRNAVIAALADAVVVIEAAARSGSLNTAAWAADASKPVMAFPGDVDRPKVAGCLALIHDGALLVRDATDVLAALPTYALGAERRKRVEHSRYAPSNEIERGILSALRDGPRDIEALLDALDAEPGTIVAALTDLQIAGAIQTRGGRRYAVV